MQEQRQSLVSCSLKVEMDNEECAKDTNRVTLKIVDKEEDFDVFSGISTGGKNDTVEKLIDQKLSLQQENDFLLAELTQAKVELAELKMDQMSSGETTRAALDTSASTNSLGGNESQPPQDKKRQSGFISSSSSTSGREEGRCRSRLAGCLVVSGVSSGVGKTTVASCLSLSLLGAGVVVQPFKVGPDFLDGKHLEKHSNPDSHAAKASTSSPSSLGLNSKSFRPCVNLDGWLLGGKAQCIEAFHCALAKKYENEKGDEPIVALIEGCMGLYDGKDGNSEAGSTAEIAKWLHAPVILVLDCSAMARSAAALLRGFQVFDSKVQLVGTVLNKVYMGGLVDSLGDMSVKASREEVDALQRESPHVQWLEEAIGSSAVILGAIPTWKEMKFPERHLGLKYPHECNNARSLKLVSEMFLDSDQILKIAGRAKVPGYDKNSREALGESVFPKPISRIGVAFDEAFCFYYHDNLLLLQDSGAELVYFSPLHDSELPRGIQALYLGGGHPENFASRLEENHSMREEIRAFAKCGGIVYAECGGLMYLSKSLEVTTQEERDQGGGLAQHQQHDMVGVFPFRTRMTGKANLGYVSVKIAKKNGIFPNDVDVRGQFFHFSQVIEERVIGGLHSRNFSNGSVDLNKSFSLDNDSPDLYSEIYEVRLEGISNDERKIAQEGYNTKNVLASFLHLHFRSNPLLASHFVGACSLVDADELRDKMVKMLYQIQASATNEMAMNPLYHNLKSMSAESKTHSSSDGAPGSLDYSMDRSNGHTGQHNRCASCSYLSTADYSSSRSTPSRSAKKGASYNDILSNLNGGGDSPGKFYKGSLGSQSYGDIEALRRMNISPKSASGPDHVSYITIPSELAICTLSPQATEMVCALGLEERLVAITDLCDYPPNIHQGRHLLSKSKLKCQYNSYHHFGEGDSHGAAHVTHRGGIKPKHSKQQSAKQIDSKLSEIRNKKESLFAIDVSWLKITRPGTIITQDTCKSCSPDNTGVVTDALVQSGMVDKSTKQPIGCSVLNLKAYIFSDIFQHLIEIGSMCGAYKNAVQLVGSLRRRLRDVAQLVSKAEYRPRVISFEGISPLVIGGHWLPEMKLLAGGSDPLQEPGCMAQRVNWQKVKACAPEILILTPCSSSPLQTLSEVNILASMPGWWTIPAVYRGEVYIVDHAYFSRPGPRLVDGVELLAHIINPSLVKLAPKLKESRDILKFTLKHGQRCNPKQLASHFKPYSPQD
jgi:cobyrinic acid a,c-diamide synthase